jgi:heptosyltransferase-3
MGSMNDQRCAVFSCLGLGDGLLALVLAHNLAAQGAEVTLFHPGLQGLQRWFPHVALRAFSEEIGEYDRLFFFYEKTPWMQAAIAASPPEKACILNPIATPNRDYLYWENGKFDGTRSFVDNLHTFCLEVLQMPHAVKSNGIVIPPSVTPRRFPKRVIIHPTSSRAGKNWSAHKYLALAERLHDLGYEPVFVLTAEERKEWPDLARAAPLFASLDELAAYVCESGSMIGNDSGIGHLASCLGLPTVTICRSLLTARFWRPDFGPGAILTPPAWIPNIKGLRLRDKHWQKAIPVRRVLTAFLDVEKACNREKSKEKSRKAREELTRQAQDLDLEY